MLCKQNHKKERQIVIYYQKRQIVHIYKTKKAITFTSNRPKTSV